MTDEISISDLAARARTLFNGVVRSLFSRNNNSWRPVNIYIYTYLQRGLAGVWIYGVAENNVPDDPTKIRLTVGARQVNTSAVCVENVRSIPL